MAIKVRDQSKASLVTERIFNFIFFNLNLNNEHSIWKQPEQASHVEPEVKAKSDVGVQKH